MRETIGTMSFAVTRLQSYIPGNAHQEYVDRRMAELNPQQRARIGRLWAEKQRLHPNMPNRGISFVKIMEFVAAGEKREQKPLWGGQSTAPQKGITRMSCIPRHWSLCSPGQSD
jgi:hypothetical protein